MVCVVRRGGGVRDWIAIDRELVWLATFVFCNNTWCEICWVCLLVDVRSRLLLGILAANALHDLRALSQLCGVGFGGITVLLCVLWQRSTRCASRVVVTVDNHGGRVLWIHVYELLYTIHNTSPFISQLTSITYIMKSLYSCTQGMLIMLLVHHR